MIVPHQLSGDGFVTPVTVPLVSNQRTQSLVGLSVLLVEDEALIAMELEFALLDAGAVVIGPAGRLEEAHALLRANDVDAALLDVDLNGIDVFPVADALIERDVPFLFHTGHAERRDLAERYGNAPVCRKPTPTEQVVAVLGTLRSG